MGLLCLLAVRYVLQEAREHVAPITRGSDHRLSHENALPSPSPAQWGMGLRRRVARAGAMVIWWGVGTWLETVHNQVRYPAGAGTLHYQRLVLTVFDGCSCVSRPFILSPSDLRLWLGGDICPTPLP